MENREAADDYSATGAGTQDLVEGVRKVLQRGPVHVCRWLQLQLPELRLLTRAKGAVMPRGSSPKRERQYEHIRESEEQRGVSPARATQIAARTVNKERARSGEARTASRSSVNDISSSRRGGLRSHVGAGGPTKAQLYNEARQRGIKGRSSMSKAQLARALGR